MTSSTTGKAKTKRLIKASPRESTTHDWKAYETGYLAASNKNQVSHGEQRKRLAPCH